MGKIQVLAMILIRVPFHLGLREPDSCYCSSVRGGHTKYLPLYHIGAVFSDFFCFYNTAYTFPVFSGCILIKRLRNNYIW